MRRHRTRRADSASTVLAAGQKQNLFHRGAIYHSFNRKAAPRRLIDHLVLGLYAWLFFSAQQGQVPQSRAKPKCTRAIPLDIIAHANLVSCSWVASQFCKELGIRELLYYFATRSRETDGFGWLSYLLRFIGNYSKSQGSHGNLGIALRYAICHNAREFWNFCQPTPVFFLLKVDCEIFR